VSSWTPESPIREECWQEFQHLKAVLWDQLVFLHTSLFPLREVASFPVRWLKPDDQWYLIITERALLDSVVLGINRLTTDQSGDLLTLPRFRNLVLAMVRGDSTTEFRRKLKSTSPDPALEDLARRARELRDGRIAHLRLEDIKHGVALKVAVSDLEALVGETERLFAPLLFGAEAKFVPPVYDPEVRQINSPWVTDYEAVLNGLARQSHVIAYPEQARDLWPRVRNEWPEDELKLLNHWRRRMGLPAA